MTPKKMWHSSLAAVAAATLVAGSLLGQSSPQPAENTLRVSYQTPRTSSTQSSGAPLDSLLDFYFAPDTASVEKHLLKSTLDQLAKLDSETRNEILNQFMFARNFEQEGGVVSKRVSKGKTVLELQPKGSGETISVTVDVQAVSGKDAIIWATIHLDESQQMPVVVYMKQEEGRWCVARAVEGLAGSQSPLAMLDSPNFAENLVRPRRETTQASAVGSLRTLNTAEVTYSSTYPHGFSPDLKSLDGEGTGVASETNAELIDSVLGSGTKSGYNFIYTPGPKDASGVISSYSIVARPVQFGRTGQFNYYTDQSGVIRMTKEDRPAGPNDPPLAG